MADNAYPVLCGGTFFALLLQARKQRTSKRIQSLGKSDGLSETEVLAALIKIMYPNFQKPDSISTFKSNVSDYKACKISDGSYLPMTLPSQTAAFDKTVKNKYQSALALMSGFVDRFIETGDDTAKELWLVKAIIELTGADKSIAAGQSFYVCEDGSAITKENLKTVTDVCLPAFLLGIWHFIVLHRPNNEAGKHTYLEWHKKPDYKRAMWDFISNIGSGISHHINVYTLDTVEDENDNVSEEPEQEPLPGSDENTSADADPKRITVNNYGTVENQKFVSIETMNGDINL